MKHFLPILALAVLEIASVTAAQAQQSADSRRLTGLLASGSPVRNAEPAAAVPRTRLPGTATRTTAAWTAVANLTLARGQHAAVPLNNKIYVWGGYTGTSGGGTEFNSLEIYDVATNSWSAGASYPILVRGQAHAVGVNGLIYSFCGASSTQGIIGSCYSYNPATNAWTSIAAMPTAQWEAAAVTAPDGRIYVFGGTSNPALTQIYTPGTNTWSTGANLPVGRHGHAAAMDADGLIHIMGGVIDFNANVATASHNVYNPTTNTWTTAADLPVAENQAGGTLGADGKIYVVGGKGNYLNNTGPFFNSVYVYTPATNSWATGTSLPITLSETRSVTVGSDIYTLAGSNGAQQSVVYRMSTTATYTWTGATSTDWNTGSNWSGGAVPTSTDDVTIPGGLARYPVVTTSTPTAHVVTISSGASLTINSGGTLSVSGNFSNSGTFTANGGLVNLNGSSSQSIGGSSRTAFWNLTVSASGATLTGAADIQRVLVLNGNLTTSGQPFTLLSGSTGTAMVVNSGGTVVGAATVQRDLDPSLNNGLGYRHYSSPVTAATVGDLATAGFIPLVDPRYNTNPATASPFPNVYSYNESRITGASATTQAFEQGYVSPNNLGSSLVAGRGYTVNISASEKVALTGTLNTGTVAVGALSRGNQENSGWHLLGNPYPAPLNWNVARAALPTGVLDAIYVYKSSDQYEGTYQTYVNGVGTLPGGLIGSMQGFFLRVSQPVASFSFQDSWRSTSYQNPAFNRATAEARPLVQLDLVSAQGTHEPTFVYFEQGATAGFDAHYDAEKLPNPTGLNLSSVAAGTNLAVSGLPGLMAAITVPLAVGVPTTGTYTLQAAALLNLSSTDVYLHDAVTGRQINLKQQSNYSFTASNAALIKGRFSLSFGPLRPTATKSGFTAASVSVYPNPASQRVTVLVPAVSGESKAQLTLLNVLGQPVRTVMLALPTAGAQAQLNVQDLPAGLYVLRVKAGNTTVAKQVVVH